MVGLLVFGLPQGSLAEREHFLPAVHRLFLTVRRAIVVEEPVTGAIVAMELVLLAVRSSLDWTTRPPQQSITASKPFNRHPARNACRPPEQVPNTPILPLT